MQNTGFESDLFEDDSSDALIDSSSDGFEDGFEDAFGEDAFEDDGFEAAGDGFEEEGFEEDALTDDAFESEGFEEDGFEEEGFEDSFAANALDEGEEFEEDAFEGFEDDGADAIEQAFADAMDAEDEDEFVRRLWGRLRRAARVASPMLRRIGRRVLPMAMRLLREGARNIGGVAAQEVRGAVGGMLGGGGQPAEPQPAEPMDAFADALADEAFSEDELDQFAPVLGGLAARFAVRHLTSPTSRAARPGQARALGQAVTRATTQAARTVVGRQGLRALRAVPRIVRLVTITIRRRRINPRQAAALIRRTAARVAASPRATARLARPSPAARRLRARAGARPGLGRPALGQRPGVRIRRG
jgi:hypothetical protein